MKLSSPVFSTQSLSNPDQCQPLTDAEQINWMLKRSLRGTIVTCNLQVAEKKLCILSHRNWHTTLTPQALFSIVLTVLTALWLIHTDTVHWEIPCLLLALLTVSPVSSQSRWAQTFFYQGQEEGTITELYSVYCQESKQMLPEDISICLVFTVLTY